MTSLLRSSDLVPAELGEILPSIVTEVAERVFFAAAEPCDATQFEALRATLSLDEGCETGPTGGWLSAQVQFRGLVAGWLEVHLPESLAQDLCAAITGSARSFSEPELLDGVGELGNILCGALLTRAARERRFELLPPRVARTAGRLSDAHATGGWETVLPVRLNDYPALVKLTLHQS